MSEKIINDKLFRLGAAEFNQKFHHQYNHLQIVEFLGFYERAAGLIRDLRDIFETGRPPLVVCKNVPVGGWLPIKLSHDFEKIHVIEHNKIHLDNITSNLKLHSIKNIYINTRDTIKDQYILFIDSLGDDGGAPDEKILNHIKSHQPVVLSVKKLDIYRWRYRLTEKYIFSGEKPLYLYIPQNLYFGFRREFHYYITESGILDYDNMIHLTMIVKNAAPLIESVLTENLPIIDRWTILDTGSTDDTIDIIKRVLGDRKKGKLYQEPFINFRDSRNRCLDLAGTKCKYTLMLDDTYIVKGGLRDFLNVCRGDQVANSYSIYIQSDDNEYVSNRVIKTEGRLRYIYQIHEVIQVENNVNVCIPNDKTHILDHNSDYMKSRTINRAEADLELLFQETEKNPDDPRHLNYIAQTYALLKKYDLALKYYIKRARHPIQGFIQEKAVALFEAARLSNFELNRPWKECESLYLRSFDLDNTRPESLYFIGIHYYLEGIFDLAYSYLKRAWTIGYPVHSQYSLKPTISFYYIPKFLAEMCYLFKDWETGALCSRLFLEKNDPECVDWNLMNCWNKIFLCMVKSKPKSVVEGDGGGQIICFIDGGDMLTRCSETYIIEMSRYIKEFLPDFRVVVFCNTPASGGTPRRGVEYMNIGAVFDFISKNPIRHCVVSRGLEYIPLAVEGHVENIYIALHDLPPPESIIPIHPKIRRVFCLTRWHVSQFTELFPMFSDITTSFNYGGDPSLYSYSGHTPPGGPRFIYSSPAGGGLSILLELWPMIIEKYKDSTLEIFCDLENSRVLDQSDQIEKARDLLEKYKCHPEYNIVLRGRPRESQLAESWAAADIWFYPCIFKETFCMEAIEAAGSRTLVVTTDLAGLGETVGPGGVVIPGNPHSQEWKEEALGRLFGILEDGGRRGHLINQNYEWATGRTWLSRARELVVEYFSEQGAEHFSEQGAEQGAEHFSEQGSEQGAEQGAEHFSEQGVSRTDSTLSKLSFYYNFCNCMETTKILVVGKTTGEFYKNLTGGVPDFLENYTSLEVGRLRPIYRLIYIESQKVYNDKKTVVSLWEKLEYGGFMVVVRPPSKNTVFYTPLELENSNSIAEGAELSILEKNKNFLNNK